MLKPTHIAHGRNHSFESNTPPPYIQSPNDIYTKQDNDVLSGRSMGRELDELTQDYNDDLLSQVHQINDPDLLKQLLIQKEQERQGLASNLDLAARLGLDLHQQIQRLELESTVQIQSLQDENHALQSKANMSQELQYQLANSEHEVKELTGHNRFLQRELDTCRQELKTFRKELDELSEHMAEISTEMFDAKSKVNSYARRLGEVEQELAATQELNVNLQIQLDNTLQKQKQTHSSTTQAVKLIQSDLGRVFSDSDTMRMTLEELETRQMKCEGKVMEMMTNTREYAQLLEEAQETIHTLRIESDMEGRGWSSRGPQAAIWDNKTGEHPEQHLRDFGVSKPDMTRQLSGAVRLDETEELRPMFDTHSWTEAGSDSLGMELGLDSLDKELDASSHKSNPGPSNVRRGLGQGLAGLSRELDQNVEGYIHILSLDQELAENRSYLAANQGSLASELAAIENRSLTHDVEAPHSISTLTTDTPRIPIDDDVDDDDVDDDDVDDDDVDDDDIEAVSPLPPRFSLSAELRQRLEENNILQNILSVKPSWTSSSSSTNAIGISNVLGPKQHSLNSIRDIGRTLSMMTLAGQKASSSISSMNTLLSPKSSPMTSKESDAGRTVSSSTTFSATVDFVPSGPETESMSGSDDTDVANSSFSSTISSPGARRATLETQNILGLKYLLSATSSADLSNVITKTNAKSTSASNNPNSTPAKVAKSPHSYTPTAGRDLRGTTPTTNGIERSGVNPISSPDKTRTSSTASTSLSSGSNAKQFNNASSSRDRTTPSRPIPIAGSSNVRSGHQKTVSPASSWSSSTSTFPTTSLGRRPSLPQVTSPSSSRSRPPWN